MCQIYNKKNWPLYQSTLKSAIKFHGFGVHSANPSQLIISPAPVDTGIVFIRKNEKGENVYLPALSREISATGYATILGHGTIRVEMIEHVMAAIAAFRLDNLYIEITTNELPILDGGAFSYCESFSKAKILQQDKKRQYILIKKPVKVESADGFAEFVPFEGQKYDVTIDFKEKIIAKSQYIFDLDAQKFHQTISRARTFGFVKDVEFLWASGMALGSSLDNSIVIGEDEQIVNPKGLYFENEFVRHKLLDTIGDSALLGAPFIGLLRSYRGGHGLNAKLVNALLDDSLAYQFVHLDEIALGDKIYN